MKDIGVVCFVLFLISTPLESSATLTSSNFILENPTIGNLNGSTMTSENFSISHGVKNLEMVQKEDETTQENEGGSYGSLIRVKEKPSVESIISATNKTNETNEQTVAKQRIEAIQLNKELKNSKTEDHGEDNSFSPDPSEKDPENDELHSSQNLASVISSNVTHFPARIIIFVWVLVVLYFIRTYTAFGRKYRPF